MKVRKSTYIKVDETITIHCAFVFNNKIINQVPLKKGKTLNFSQYIVIRDNLEMCHELADSMLQGKSGKLLLGGLVTIYANAFTRSDSGGYPKLEAKDVFKDESLRAFHQKVLDDRHKMFAHREENNNEIVKPIYVRFDDGSEGIAPLQLYKSSYSDEELKEFKKAIETALEFVEDKLHKVVRRIKQEMDKSWPLEQREQGCKEFFSYIESKKITPLQLKKDDVYYLDQ